jgi:hypothetical protein
MSIRKHLKVAIGMPTENFQDIGVHKRLAANDAKEKIALLVGFANDAGERVDFDLFLLRRNVDPAALAAKIAAIDDRDVEKWGEKVAPPETLLVFLNRSSTLKRKVVRQLPKQSQIGFGQQTFGVAEVHIANLAPLLAVGQGGATDQEQGHCRGIFTLQRPGRVRLQAGQGVIPRASAN